ncbi:MAG: hypothetical protein Q8R58_03185 [Sulfuricurvum sp.]|nr:hypothetical protein [Sulfuricurvum sp.]
MSNGNFCKPDSCPAGQSNITGYCSPIDPAIGAPLPDPMNDFNDDPAGCDSAGGYYFADGSCNGAGEALSKMFQDPLAVVGAMLSVGGVTFGAGGALASVALAATPVGVVTVGTLAAVAGVGSLVASGVNLFDWSTQPATDVTNGSDRIKVSLTTSGGSTGTVAGTNVTKTDITSGKVTQNVFIPDTVKASMAVPSNVNKDTGALNAPISTAGVRVTTYDYTTKKATSVTQSPTSTSAVPVTTSVTSVFTISQNVDGTTTATTTTQANAPTVSGSNGGSVISSGGGSSGTDTTGTTGTTGTSPDYSAVLGSIKTNTGVTATLLGDIKSLFSGDGFSNVPSDDGSSTFNTLKSDVSGSFNGFILTDPLNLNSLGGGAGIQSYGFTLYGRHFVILDQAMINQLPIDMIKGLFLFIGALLGLITVLSGV